LVPAAKLPAASVPTKLPATVLPEAAEPLRVIALASLKRARPRIVLPGESTTIPSVPRSVGAEICTMMCALLWEEAVLGKEPGCV
jgi:hypothetical protein